MLGDNIHHSLDSRHWGLVPDDFIVGVVQWIWFSKMKSKIQFVGIESVE